MQTHRQRISGSLLALFVAYYFNIAFFPHEHIVDGVRIVHSHIHNKCHSGQSDCHNDAHSGGHSPEELFLIFKNSAFETLGAVASIDVLNPLTMTCDDTKFFVSGRVETGFVVSYFLRGPPRLALLAG